ncbi:DUF2164 domain-containing protein [Alteromonas sediminis]|uniref:DUF2164 domain-containing protein n=1 Tax=Alteromonas sediminis TaxID=2259342 RepID=A0A3N5Y879_9ALTE|nr:DUF2164 domain-containing protein [Alteromonas sediminis]RPJ67189.1 DUF2164 domain-containing protein [Alteromonas sediminis]
MSKIELSPDAKSSIVEKIQDYFESELAQEIGQFDAEFLLDFFTREVGAYYYNQGLYDARAIFEERLSTIDDDIYAIEKEVK